MAELSSDERWTLALDDGLIVHGSERADSPVLERFFKGYDRAFILPDEREELEGFRACLALNPVARHRFGRQHRELVITLATAAGKTLGGANFLAIGHAGSSAHVTVALNYLFIDQAARGRGLTRQLLDAVGRLAMRATDRSEAGTAHIFIEQNDPFKLTPAEYRADTDHAGLDQVDRLAIWSRLGARALDFNYIQPALSPTQAHDDGLLYAALAFPGADVPARLLHDHLESFFAISVMKGGEVADDPDAAGQLQLLAAMASRGEAVALLDLTTPLQRLCGRPDLPGYATMLDFAKSFQSDQGR